MFLVFLYFLMGLTTMWFYLSILWPIFQLHLPWKLHLARMESWWKTSFSSWSTYALSLIYFNFYSGAEKQKWRLNPKPLKFRFQLRIEWILHALKMVFEAVSSFYWNKLSNNQIAKLIMTLSVLKQNQKIQYAWKENPYYIMSDSQDWWIIKLINIICVK